MGNVLPEALSVGGDQVFGGQVAQFFVGGVEQLAADGLRGVVVECSVGGEDGALRACDADELVGGDDVAEPLAAVDDVIPRRFAVVFLFREAVQLEIGDQPRGVFGDVQTVLRGIFDDAGGDHQRHGGDNVLRGQGDGFAA